MEKKNNLYYCENSLKHRIKIRIKRYNQKYHNGITRYLYACTGLGCGELYFKYKTGQTPIRIGEESILISNIDSPTMNSIPCPDCGHKAKRSNRNNEPYQIYFCEKCYTVIKINTKDKKIEVLPEISHNQMNLYLKSLRDKKIKY